MERLGADGRTVVDDSEKETLAGAWPRFWARVLDIALYVLPLAFLAGFLFPELLLSPVFEGPAGGALLGAMLLPIALLIDAVIVSVFGNSAGKAIAGIRVETRDRERLDFLTSLRRNLQVYIKGMALGFPLFSLLAYWMNYLRLEDGMQSYWDEALSTRVYNVRNNAAFTTLAAGFYVAIKLSFIVLAGALG